MSLMGSIKTRVQQMTSGGDAAAAQAKQDRQDRQDNYNTVPDPFRDHPMNCNCTFHR
jgi:hypothetical protein